MGWSYRKSFGAGPFRINFSKSGISYSVGVKGARVNVGPRGTYVNLSAHGISYRQKISGSGAALSPAVPGNPVTVPSVYEPVHHISSAAIEQLTDTDSKDFIEELSEKAAKISYVNWLGIFPFTIFLLVLLMTSFGSRTVISSPVTDSALVRVTFLKNPYAAYEFAGGVLGFILLIIRLKRADKKRFETELHYEMDEQFKQVYQEFGRHFNNFSASVRIWQYLNAHQTSDFKRNAGAGKLIKRTPVAGIAGHRVPLRHFVTNIAIPFVKLSNLELYFLPERLLIKRGNTFAAVFYKHLQISSATARFIEDESVPRDAQIVDRTWRYVNKNGGPDRRFNNNRQMPICAYSEYTLRSGTGVYEVITTSKPGAMDGFANFLHQIGQLQSRLVMN